MLSVALSALQRSFLVQMYPGWTRDGKLKLHGSRNSTARLAFHADASIMSIGNVGYAKDDPVVLTPFLSLEQRDMISAVGQALYPTDYADSYDSQH